MDRPIRKTALIAASVLAAGLLLGTFGIAVNILGLFAISIGAPLGINARRAAPLDVRILDAISALAGAYVLGLILFQAGTAISLPLITLVLAVAAAGALERTTK